MKTNLLSAALLFLILNLFAGCQKDINLSDTKAAPGLVAELTQWLATDRKSVV